MCVAMSLFLIGLLLVVYSQIAHTYATPTARSVVESLVPFVLGILVICGVLFFYLTNRLVLAPIKRIRDAALAISNGKLDTVISAAQNDEIGDLAQSVDQMATALRRDIQSLKEVDELKSEFIAISSHNLRTPLASIQGGLDMLQDVPLDNQATRMLQIIRASAANLVAFSEDMVTIADVESGQGAAGQTPTPLGTILAPLIAGTDKAAAERQITFTTKLENENTRINANSLLRLAFRNILDNACKFTKAGGSITLTSSILDGQLVVRVTDTGIGIASEELPNLFTKFHRGTPTLTYNYEGVGVGLYLAKLIVEQHHGSIAVSSTLHHGTECTIRLPLISKQS